MQPDPSPDHPSTRPRFQRIEAVVNPAAGSVGAGATEALREIVAAFGATCNAVETQPDNVEALLRKAVDASPDLLVVLAGDGTARLAADLCGSDGPLLAPLAGGTVNMLPRALYGPRPWREALSAALSQGVARDVSGGVVGGQRFYCAAILGAPALWAPAREAARAGQLARALRHAALAWRRAFSRRLRYRLDGGAAVPTLALSLICPLVSSRLQEETALEAASLDIHDAVEAMQLGFHGALGDWRAAPEVDVRLCTQGEAWARRPIPALFDGELHRLGRRADIAFVPRAFRALAPPP
ncbi:MAG TPA: diacylglycerol kinase family protein [Caulobacteraceae bacterium]|nr:diacylglycerol kinase family protein [Caulobacteraceae bacterium]